MARTWLSIRVDLVEGHGELLRPRPGRIFAAARTHTFEQFADSIDDAFARWDRSHLQEFTLADGTRLALPDPEWEIDGVVTEDLRRIRLSRLQPGDQFVYVFDLGDDWGWGDIPDQYRRRWDGDDTVSPRPKDPKLADLPPLRPHWGRQRTRPPG